MKQETINGDTLAEQLTNITTFIRLSKVEEKLRQYYRDLNTDTVQLPDWMKPKEQQIDFIVNAELQRIVKDNILDNLYQRAIEDEKD